MNPKKPINNWTNGGLERALRNTVVQRHERLDHSVDSVAVPKRIFDEVRRRLLGRHIPANPYVRIHGDYDHSDGYPHFRGGVDDQCFDPKSDNYTETTSAEVNGLVTTILAKDDVIKREQDRRGKELHKRQVAIDDLEARIQRQYNLLCEHQRENQDLVRQLVESRTLHTGANTTIERQSGAITHRDKEIEKLEGIIDRQDDIIQEDRAKRLADRDNMLRITLREVYKRLKSGD